MNTWKVLYEKSSYEFEMGLAYNHWRSQDKQLDKDSDNLLLRLVGKRAALLGVSEEELSEVDLDAVLDEHAEALAVIGWENQKDNELQEYRRKRGAIEAHWISFLRSLPHLPFELVDIPDACLNPMCT